MNYIIIEQQTDKGTTAVLTQTKDNINEAEQAYHTALAYASVSTIDKHSATMLKGKLKKKYGFANNAKLDIDEDKIELEDPQDDRYNLDRLKSKPNYARFVTNLVDREIYTVDGIYKVEGLNIEFPSLSELYDYLEGEENYD